MLLSSSILMGYPALAACVSGDPTCWTGELPNSFGGLHKPKATDAVVKPQDEVKPTVSVKPVPPNTESASLGPSLARGSKAGDMCQARAPSTPFSFSVDGKPMDGRSERNAAESQICTDNALRKADIQIRYDGMSNEPSLNVVAEHDANNPKIITFKTATNYALQIKRGEIRIFDKDASPMEAPATIVPLKGESVTWVASSDSDKPAKYVLRVYDAEGRFDETTPKSIGLIKQDFNPDSIDAGQLGDSNSRLVKNIPVSGGSILVSGSRVPAGNSVTVMGLPVKVDSQGNFAMRQIVASGDHDVEVAISNKSGVATVFSRSATIPENDFFYVALADLTVGTNHARGPIALLNPDQADDYKDRYYVDGRLAFYLKGKIKGDTLITASADTRDQPIRTLFSNFNAKDPRYLLRNLDPNRYYPVYGDDSTLVEDAPTRGKFYIRIDKGDNNILWGNFKTSITGTEYVRYDRGLYGARVQLKTDESTRFGERRGQFEAFAAEPGTLGVRDVFRGTGGSVYFLSRQNITEGSERLTIETRDSVSGLVLSTRTLSATEDYDVSYLQGRVTLKNVLLAVGTDGMLIQSGGSSRTVQYLVANYEYSPLEMPTRDYAFGGRATYWLNDYVQFGATAYDQTTPGEKLALGGADLTLRYSPSTYMKFEIARSSGTGSGENLSVDGGFNFVTRTTTGAPAYAKRIEAAADLAELIPDAKGRLAAYWKHKDANFSGPGEYAVTTSATEMGARADVVINDKWLSKLKLDYKKDDYNDHLAGEGDLSYKISDVWQVTGGVRVDRNTVNQLSASPDLNRNGTRVDVALRLDYNAHEKWGLYGYGQASVVRTGDRLANNRVGVGGFYKFNDDVSLAAEVSEGNLGLGAQVGLEYKKDENRTYYMNYALDPDRTDIIERGGLGLMTTGVRYRYSDNLSVFGEEHFRSGGGYSGMTHAYGLDFSPASAWKTGVKFETGRLSDPITGDVKRIAVSPSLSYSDTGINFNGRVEYRHDDTTAFGGLTTTQTKRNTFLINDKLSVKIDPDWRFIGTLAGSYSKSTSNAPSPLANDFSQGNYLEAVTGFAYRPVANDRLNLLMKYTYFYNVPTDGQVIKSGSFNAYSQKSHVFSIDAIYDVNRYLSIGGKAAYRFGSLKDNTTPSGWYKSSTGLLIARADFHVVKQWDITAELRRYSVSAAQDKQFGALLAIYRHVNDNFKIGVGYNFSRYSDDLTNLSTNNRGFFVNAIGMF